MHATTTTMNEPTRRKASAIGLIRAAGSALVLFGCATVATAADAPANAPKPFLLDSKGQEFQLLKNWTFGNKRPDATVRSKADLDQDFYYRYIWEQGKLDKFKTYWSYHRDYPEGDAQSVHVFSDDALTLKGRIPTGGGLRERGIESGMLRAKIPIVPGMYMEMRAKLPGGVGVWPSYWLEQGVQHPDKTFSQPSKVMSEIDIFEFFNWDNRPETRIFTGNTQTFAGAAAYGNPYDIFSNFKNVGYEKHLDLGFDCSKDFHIFALDWVNNKPVWLLDGKPIKQTYYEWHGPPAHLTVVNAIGMNLSGVKQTQMVIDEERWNFAIDHIRIWERKAGAIAMPGPLTTRNVRDLNTYAKTGGRLEINAAGKWENPMISESKADAATLKTNPVLKVDITVPPDADEAGKFSAKLAIQGEGFERTESPQWLLDRSPGKAGIPVETITWDLSSIAATLPENPNWFKIELVTQGSRARTIYASNLRAEERSGKPADAKAKAAPETGAVPAQVPLAAGKTDAPVQIAATGKWQSPVIATPAAEVRKMKKNSVLKVDISVPAEAAGDGWFMAKLAINAPGIDRTESPKWLLERAPGKAGIDKLTLSWDVADVIAKVADDANWFKIELVTQGNRPRTISVSNIRAEAAGGAATTVALKPEAPAAPVAAAATAPAPALDGYIPYPDPKNEAAWPGRGPIRSFDFMKGERQSFVAKREKDQGAIVFVGDSLTGGWKNLAKDFPKLKVANRGVGGDVSRGVLFRFKTDVLTLNPKAVVIEIGNNDLTAFGAPADMLSNLTDILAMLDKEKPGTPVVLCSIPPSANPKAPLKPESRQAMNEGIRKKAAERPNTSFCDLYAALVQPDGSPKLEFYFDDKLHFNDAGHSKWAELLTPILEKLK